MGKVTVLPPCINTLLQGEVLHYKICLSKSTKVKASKYVKIQKMKALILQINIYQNIENNFLMHICAHVLNVEAGKGRILLITLHTAGKCSLHCKSVIYDACNWSVSSLGRECRKGWKSCSGWNSQNICQNEIILGNSSVIGPSPARTASGSGPGDRSVD